MRLIFLGILAAVFFVVITYAFMGWLWAIIAAGAVIMVYVITQILPP